MSIFDFFFDDVLSNLFEEEDFDVSTEKISLGITKADIFDFFFLKKKKSKVDFTERITKLEDLEYDKVDSILSLEETIDNLDEEIRPENEDFFDLDFLNNSKVLYNLDFLKGNFLDNKYFSDIKENRALEL